MLGKRAQACHNERVSDMSVTVVFSSAPRDGATMCAVSLAQAKASCGARTLLIYASGKRGSYYAGSSFLRSVDDIKANIISGELRGDDVKEVTERAGDIDVIPAVRDSFGASGFPVDTIGKITSLCESYEEIVVDAGSDFSRAMSVSALNAGDDIIFVVTQEPHSTDSFNEIKRRVLTPLGIEASVIINMFRRDPALFTKNEVARLTGTGILSVLPYSELGMYAELSGKSLMADRAFRKAVGGIAQVDGVQPRGIFRFAKDRRG